MKRILLTLILLSTHARAHDGDHCHNPFFQNLRGITTGVQGFFGEYDTANEQFDYFVATAELGYNYKNRFFASLRVPFAHLENDLQQRDWLLSDIQIQLQGSLLNWGQNNFLSFGVNLEIPTGNEDKYVGGGHIHYRPYIGFQQNFGEMITYGQFGFLFSPQSHTVSGTGHVHDEDDHGEEDHVHGSVIDVHSDREATFQVGATYPILHDLYFNMSMAGQTVLTNTNANIGDFYMTANPALTLIITERSTFTMFTQLPVTNLKRFDYRLGVGINYIF